MDKLQILKNALTRNQQIQFDSNKIDCKFRSVKVLPRKIRKTRQMGVYFLFKGNEVVYIGESKNIIERLRGHTGKDYNWFSFIVCSNRKDVEVRLIRKCAPKLNSQNNSLASYIKTLEQEIKELNAAKKKEFDLNKILENIRQKYMWFRLNDGYFKLFRVSLYVVGILWMQSAYEYSQEQGRFVSPIRHVVEVVMGLDKPPIQEREFCDYQY